MTTQSVRFITAILATLLMAPSVGLAETQEFQNLHYGNNFLSFNVLPENPTPEAVFGDKVDWVSQIIGEGQVAYRLESGEWIGNLKSFNRKGAYWVFFNLPMGVASPFSMEVEGDLSDPDILYDLHEGLNWVSYPHTQNSAITAGIPDDIEPLFTKVLGEGDSTLQTGSGWVGSLQSFLPGYGYKLEVTEAVEGFNYGCSGCDGASEYTYGCKDPFASNYDETVDIPNSSCTYSVPESWAPVPGGGQAFYILHNLRINGAPLQEGDVVGAFSNGVNVGFGFPEGDFTTVPAMSLGDGDPVTFIIYDTSTGTEHPVAPTETLEWAESAVEILGCLGEGDNASDVATLGLDNCAGPCEAQTCEDQEKECGLIEDGCGLALDCGSCSDGLSCNEDFLCVTECIPTTCDGLGVQCGSHDDGCGGTVECASCEEFYTCDEEGGFVCICDAPECAEEDVTIEEDIEETDAVDMSCDFFCGGVACNFKCMDNMIYTCQSDTWEFLEDCEAQGLTCELILSEEDELTGEYMCTGGEIEPDTTPEEDITEEEDTEEPVEEEDITEPEEEEPEEEDTQEEATEEVDTAPESEEEEEVAAEEEEEVAAEDDGGCGSCAVGQEGSGIPPKGGLFLVVFALLMGYRLRESQLQSDQA